MDVVTGALLGAFVGLGTVLQILQLQNFPRVFHKQDFLPVNANEEDLPGQIQNPSQIVTSL